MHGRRTATALGAVALMITTACGAQTTGGGSSSKAPGRVEQSSNCPALGDHLDKAATFTWTYSVDNTSFDPDKITSNNSQMYLYPIYDALVYIDPAGEPKPMLAKSWEVTDGGDTLRMTLIDDWKYHDGTPFDAASVVANIERSKTLKGSFNANPLKPVTSVNAVGRSTVEFHTKASAGALVQVLGGSPGMMMSPAVFDLPGQDQRPTGGSGAFTMSRYVPGSKVEYTAVDHYWDPAALNVAKMVFSISGDDNARLNAVQTGASDSTFLRASMYKPARQAGLVVCEKPSLSSYSLNLNTSRSEFGDERVRQALNYAIDRNAVSGVTDGFCDPTAQMFPQSYFAAAPGIGPDTFAYDPTKAKQLLAESGHGNGFSFGLEVINLSLYQQIAEVIQANLAAVGITMSITPVDISRLADDFSVQKNVDAIFFEQKAESDPSTLTAEYFMPDGFNNPGGLSTPEIQSLQAKTRTGATPAERAPAFQKLFTAVTAQAGPSIPICNLTTPFAMTDRTRGVEIYADASRQFRGVGITQK